MWSDAQRIAQGFDSVNIGYSHIKERRLRRPVPVSVGGMLGDYVPFNFCPRSVMLYVIHRGAVEGYEGGQSPIVHLISSVGSAIKTGRPWAFTNRHADLQYAKYFDSLDSEAEVDWQVMPLTFWADSDETKAKRQAEFLAHDWFPFAGIEEIGVKTEKMANKVREIVDGTEFSPRVSVKRSWYY